MRITSIEVPKYHSESVIPILKPRNPNTDHLKNVHFYIEKQFDEEKLCWFFVICHNLKYLTISLSSQDLAHELSLTRLEWALMYLRLRVFHHYEIEQFILSFCSKMWISNARSSETSSLETKTTWNAFSDRPVVVE